MEILQAIANWNILGAAIDIIAMLFIRKYRDIHQETGKPVLKQMILCIICFVVGIIYLLMPAWLNLIKFIFES